MTEELAATDAYLRDAVGSLVAVHDEGVGLIPSKCLLEHGPKIGSSCPIWSDDRDAFTFSLPSHDAN